MIKNKEDYKRYIELKDALKDNSEINNLINKIKKLQKEIINKEYKKENIENEEIELNNLKEELDKYPSYKEFMYLQEDLNNDFQNIKKIIENSINN